MDETPGRPVVRRRDLTLDLCACAQVEGPEAVTEALLACPGVDQVHVDRFVTWALVTFDDGRTSAREIVAHLARTGFEVTVAQLFDPADEGSC